MQNLSFPDFDIEKIEFSFELDPHTEKWSNLNESTIELLKDICGLKFSDSIVYLYGFGKQTGHWIEWKFQKAKIYAEFDI